MKKIIFMGTPDFAVPILEMLIKDFGVELVITQPDKIVGRKKILTPPPVKEIALKYGIKVLQPTKISSDEETFLEIKNINPDIIITAAYGQIVPERILELPKYKCINVHGSLLPKLRGGSPIQYAILEDYKETGVTIMYMEKSLDSGDMISKAKLKVLDSDNYLSLHNKMSILGKDLLKETLPKIFLNQINPEKQDHNEATFAWNISREDEEIDWSKSAREIFNKVRALNPKPGAFTFLNNVILKLWEVEECFDNNFIYEDFLVGAIISQDKNSLYIKCGNNTVLKILELQLAGKNKMSVRNFLSNNKNYTGIILGDKNE